MKKFFINTILLAAAATVFAQAKAENTEIIEEEIELPDVTTVVNGKTFTAGKDSVPDYTKILPETSAPEVQLPEMDGVKTSKNLPENHNRNESKSKDIYAQGELGVLLEILLLKLILIMREAKVLPAKKPTKAILCVKLP